MFNYLEYMSSNTSRRIGHEEIGTKWHFGKNNKIGAKLIEIREEKKNISLGMTIDQVMPAVLVSTS